MYPHERSLMKRLEDEPFTILGVNSDPADKYREAVERENITWPSFFDGGSTHGPIATMWGVYAWPTIYVIDDKGIIRYENVRGEQLDKAVDHLLEELKGETGE